jgi:hypothetical protein
MSELTCSYCKNEINDDSDYCPRCGTLFTGNIKCKQHEDADAEGVCVICSEPFCSECGGYVNKVFLCNEHNSYEIYEGFARIFGSSDSTQCNYVKSCLEQSLLHPIILSNKFSQMYLGSEAYSMFKSGEDSGAYIYNEIKILVPCSEVLEAEKIIRELDL